MPHDMSVIGPVAAALLSWYDTRARRMPWRVGPDERRDGIRPDPYRVWLSEVMLQQTTVATVTGYFLRFTERWPDVLSLAAAPRDAVLAEWAGLGYYARARNLHACAVTVARDLGGVFPDTEAALLELPGVGRYTAAAIAAIAFDEAATVVDGNVERVMARLHRVEEPLPGAKKALYALAARETPSVRPGDYAQAVMDLGATVCTPRNPSCDACPVAALCAARAAGVAASLPRKPPKKAKPTRYGTCYLARRSDGAVLIGQRPDAGLLGGMAELPGTEWTEDAPPPPAPPISADWGHRGEVRHTFTHFHLVLTVMRADVPMDAPGAGARWIPDDTLDSVALPTLMRKALEAGMGPGRLDV